MTGFNDRDRTGETSASDMAMLLLQLAASQAEIGPFARRGRETPQAASRHYRERMKRSADASRAAMRA